MWGFFWTNQSHCPKCIGVGTEKGKDTDIEGFDSVFARLENRNVHFHKQKWTNSQRFWRKTKKKKIFLIAAWKSMVEFWSHWNHWPISSDFNKAHIQTCNFHNALWHFSLPGATVNALLCIILNMHLSLAYFLKSTWCLLMTNHTILCSISDGWFHTDINFIALISFLSKANTLNELCSANKKDIC